MKPLGVIAISFNDALRATQIQINKANCKKRFIIIAAYSTQATGAPLTQALPGGLSQCISPDSEFKDKLHMSLLLHPKIQACSGSAALSLTKMIVG
jgi:hypothetical protein